MTNKLQLLSSVVPSPENGILVLFSHREHHWRQTPTSIKCIREPFSNRSCSRDSAVGFIVAGSSLAVSNDNKPETLNKLFISKYEIIR